MGVKIKMKFRIFALFAVLVKVAIIIPLIRSDCGLQPISFGYYYGVTKLSFEEASKCCSNKTMSLVTLNSVKDKDQLRDALVSESFWAEPIGPANGLFVLSSATLKYQRYYPRTFAESLKIQLNLNNSSICSIAYLASPHNISLSLAGVPCKNGFRYLCKHQIQPDPALCHKLNYTELIEGTYLYTDKKLEWRDARDCCEFKGGELFRTESDSDNQDLVKTDQAIGKDVSFWTGGFKKLEKTDFVWSTGEPVLVNNTANAEFCIAGKVAGKSISLVDFPCETSLPSICRMKAQKTSCISLNMTKINVKNTFRTYHYSGSYKLPWSEAVLCCRDKGLQLLTVISPQEGDQLASYFQTSEFYQHRHQGFPYGLWTNGRQRKDRTFEFVAVRTRTKFEQSGENHFIQSSSNGTCLQYVIDTRNSYFLNNIPCKSIRSFICEKSANSIYNELVEMKELGNKYFISSSKLTWAKADSICRAKDMSFLNLNNFEEKIALHPILQILAEDNVDGFWSAPHDRGFSMDFNPLPYEERKKANQKNFRRISPGFHPKRMEFKVRTTTRRPNVVTWTNCSTTIVIGGQIRVTSSNNCSAEKRVICEKHVHNFYGICDTGQFIKEEMFLFHPNAASWDMAKKCCHQMGRSLISLDKIEKRRKIYQFLKGNDFIRPNIGIWTSGTNKYTREKWAWAGIYDFIKVNLFYNDFNTFDETSLAEDDHQCLEVFANLKQGKVALANEGCDFFRPFLCDIKNVILPKACETVRFEKLRLSGFYYALSKVPWIQAQECCLQREMTLAEIHDTVVNEQLGVIVSEISDYIHDDPNFGIWIGLTSHLSNHTTFTWTGSSKSLNDNGAFTRWEESDFEKLSPNPKYGCVEGYIKDTTLLWKPMPCSTELRFICQIKQ